jgi:hypothetical protein
MEFDPTIIVGTTLEEIQKKPDLVKVVFENKRTRQTLTLSFDGVLLETAGSSLNKRVEEVKINQVLGFRTSTQLLSQRKNPQKYRELLIRMEGSTDDYKLELVGAFMQDKITLKSNASSAGKSKTKTPVAKKKTTVK